MTGFQNLVFNCYADNDQSWSSLFQGSAKVSAYNQQEPGPLRGAANRHVLSPRLSTPATKSLMQNSHVSPLQWQQIKAHGSSISNQGFVFKNISKSVCLFVFPFDTLLHLVFQWQLVVIFTGVHLFHHHR